ncbi:MAG: 23S rRNA (adenine(2503)-C(2))-methyltransferase RlmN [Bernardetiaceae bacterium]
MPSIQLKTPPRRDTRPDIRRLTLPELIQQMTDLGQPAFRAKQIYEWLWKKSVTEFAHMRNLPKPLLAQLESAFVLHPLELQNEQKSDDGTIKLALRLHEGYTVEGVLIPVPDEGRMTACISSQVGCSLSCAFCATGLLPKKRNLTAAEIYDQVVILNQKALANYGQPLTNIVYMGMGEPLLNFREVIRSAELLTSPEGLHMAARRLTVSTAGIAKMIRKLGEENARFNLALSLHAANDEKRNQIMEINETNNLAVLQEALQFYFQQTKNPVTYEYIALNGFNDSLEDAEQLYRFTKHIPCKVNIIEYNTVEGLDFAASDPQKLDRFMAYLQKKGVRTTLRRSRGKDIAAACGQLANKS